MKLCLSRLRLVPLAMLLWEVPAEVGATVLQPALRESVEPFGIEEGAEKQVQKRKFEPGVRRREKQAPETQVRGIEQADLDVLFRVEGVLAEGDGQLDDESLYDTHLFEGQAGQIVRITLTSNDFDAFLLLQDFSEEELARNDDSSEGTNAEIVFRLPMTGQYRILANTYDASGKGTYRLTVAAVDEQILRQAELEAEADRLFQQGIEANRIRQYRTAIESLQTALDLYRELDDRQGEATSLGNLGLAYDSLGEHQQAITFHQQSLEIKRIIGNRQGEAISLGNLGLAYDGLGEYRRAISFYQQSLVIVKELGDRHGEAISLGNLGIAHRKLGEYQQAINFFEQTQAILREIGDRQGEATSLGNLGISYLLIGEYQQAIDFHKQQLAIERDLGNRQGEADSLGDLGNVYYSIGEYQQAIDFHQASLEIDQAIGNREGEAASFGNLGNVYLHLGEYQQAINFHQESLAINEEINAREGEAISLGGLGLAYDGLEQYQQAIDFHKESLAINREIGNLRGEAISLGSLGNVYLHLGEYYQAIDFHQQQLAIAKVIGDRQSEATLLANLGISYRNTDRILLAENSLLSAITIFESLRSADLIDQNRINFFESQVAAYKNLELILVFQNKFETALEIAERGRTRSFVQLLSERLSKVNSQDLVQSPSFSEIQRIAKEQQSTMVEYSISRNTSGEGSSLYIWVVQPTGELHFKEVAIGESLAAISELVEQSRVAMNVEGRGGIVSSSPMPEESDATDQLNQLHQLLIEPIADLLPDDPTQRVVFIPQGDLFLIPFPALKDESDTYLIERHTVLTAPSIQTLDLTRRRSATIADRSYDTENILIVGNPVMPEVWNPDSDTFTQLLSLIGAEQEARAIANFFGTEALIGAQATEQAVKQQIETARIVHLATHGLLEYGIPEASGVRDVPGAIALTPIKEEDGLLTSAEILELDLQAELVVLSACDTGLGNITGDGVIGLSRSLIAAGTPSVIVSLWSIPDAPTAALMTEFYAQIRQGKDKAQALRQAMLITMKTHPDPGNWAAFTLVGEAD